MGWFGTERELTYTLKSMGADQDANGQVKLIGDLPCVGFDGDLVISDACYYTVDGKRKNVAATMGITSYGVSGIKVY